MQDSNPAKCSLHFIIPDVDLFEIPTTTMALHSGLALQGCKQFKDFPYHHQIHYHWHHSDFQSPHQCCRGLNQPHLRMGFEVDCRLGCWDGCGPGCWDGCELDYWDDCRLGCWDDCSLGYWCDCWLDCWDYCSLGCWDDCELGH